jgi:hypothetical protein
MSGVNNRSSWAMCPAPSIHLQVASFREDVP